MKICVISFDFWEYDAHISETLYQLGVDAHHLKIKKINHSNFWERLKNTFYKVFLKKNLKHLKRQKFVIDELRKLGVQDQILVLNPNSFDDETLSFIKKSTKKLITFLYDNLERFPVENKLHFFDKIYSFDDNDIAKYNFERLTNYNYLSFIPQEKQCPKNDVFYITSYDKKRIKQLIPLSKKLKKLGLKSKILVIANRFWKYTFLKYFTKNNIVFSTKKISHSSLSSHYKNTKVILDLMRENQYGLSFRVFEAMALEKKIITDNEKIKNYDFYNPNNILVLDENFSNLDRSFFESPYESLPIEIYEKYTIKNWIKQVFDLKENGNY